MAVLNLPRNSVVLTAVLLSLAACSTSGQLYVTNSSGDAVSDVLLVVSSSDGSNQQFNVTDIKPGESRSVRYAITSEYSLDVEVTTPSARTTRHFYGYVNDGLVEVHRVSLLDNNRLTVDGEVVDGAPCFYCQATPAKSH